MTVLIDTNVVLDILLHRQPWYDNAAMIAGLSQQYTIAAFVTASTVTDIFYIVQKQQGKSTAKTAVKLLLRMFYPASVTDSNIFRAAELEWDDFEDSVQFTVGEWLSVDYIITGNTQDFSSGSIEAVTPEDFIQIIADIEK